MLTWIRVTAVALGVGLGASAGCGGAADTVPPPRPPGCDALYFGGGDLPLPPDGASLCAPGVCSYESVSGCAATETCAPHVDTAKGTVAPECRPQGTRESGQSCIATSAKLSDQCARGLQCVDGACHRVCCGGNWAACDEGESCTRDGEVMIGKETVKAGLGLCFPVGTCDVLKPDSCKEEGKVCRIADPVGHVACMSPSSLVAGDDCDAEHQCGPLLHCVQDPDSIELKYKCRRLCEWGVCHDETCSKQAGEVCVRFNRDPGGVGECTPNWQGHPVLVDGGVVVDAGF